MGWLTFVLRFHVTPCHMLFCGSLLFSTKPRSPTTFWVCLTAEPTPKWQGFPFWSHQPKGALQKTPKKWGGEEMGGGNGGELGGKWGGEGGNGGEEMGGGGGNGENGSKGQMKRRGHLCLASAVFPEGTSGLLLDAFARRFLWQER